jgi:dsRNA-specific ribonuclease
MKISLVREEHLAFVWRKIEINDYILLWHWERKSWWDDKDVIIADTVESLIWFIYLQYGFDKALDFIEKNIYNTKENLWQINEKSSKTMVQEQTQKLYKSLPIYVDSEDTIDERWNCTLYKSELIINWNLISVWFWQNKKRAQEDAADKAIENWFLNS